MKFTANVLFLSVAMVLSVHTVAFGQSVVKIEVAPPSFFIVSVEGGKDITVTSAVLSKLPRKEVKGKDHDGNYATYSGVELCEVLLLAGAKLGKDLRGKNLANYIVAHAQDGYKAVYGITEVDEGFTDDLIIIADTKNTKPLDSDEGPWQIIVPNEKRHGRWVRQVTVIKVLSVK